MIEYWREFRVSGAPKNHGEGVTLGICHGGHFTDVGNERFEYEGGERCWVESIDPEKVSWIELNTFTWRLGYREPPMFYWFKHPLENVLLPIDDDKDTVKMLESMTKSRTLEVYCMGGGVRQIETCEMEELTPNFRDIIPHCKFKNEGQKIGTVLPKNQTKQVANEQVKRSINQKRISKPTVGASFSQL